MDSDCGFSFMVKVRLVSWYTRFVSSRDGDGMERGLRGLDGVP